MSSFRTPASFLLLLAVSSPAFAAPVTYMLSDRNGSGQVTFESKAPVEYIEGVAEGVQGMITLDPAKPNLALSGTVSVPVGRMLTGNSTRDEHLRSDEWLNEARNPSIRFDLTQTDQRTVVKKEENSWFVKVTGSFFLKGISQYVTVPLTIKIDGQKLRVDGRFVVKLADHNIHGPSGIRMIGVKVAPEVHVRLRLVGVADQGWSKVSAPAKKSGARKKRK